MSDPWDVILIGSGINALVCAAELGMKGRRVLVLERNEVAGGCLRTAEATLPGFHHDLFAMSLPLFVTAAHYPVLGPRLAEHGLRLVTAPQPTAVMMPGNRALVFGQSREANAAAFDALHPGDGAAYVAAMQDIERNAPLIFGLLGQEPRSWKTLSLLFNTLRRQRIGGMASLAGSFMRPMRAWLEQDFGSDAVRALIAPWILHTGLGPEAPLSALMGKLILFTLEAAGIPFVEGGVSGLVTAFDKLIAAQGGEVRVGSEVRRIIVERGVARGVETADGQRLMARRAVVANVTPTQLYGRLLDDPPAAQAEMARRYSYGRADMQIHLALSEPARWADPALDDVALVHVTPGLDGVSRAVNEAERGLLPAEGTIVVGQPAATDPSRVPPGQGLLWIQLQELPREVRGDAVEALAVPADGRWTPALAEAYAARILKRLSSCIPNLDTALLKTTILSPADLEAMNINLVGGDPYSGTCGIDQFHLFRPFAGGRNHDTPIAGLFHIGASTHPGPGLGGMSGHMVATRL
ncbi:MAG: FAD-dependent oxidoreductase [Sphingobium sp.]|nr:MAG: FAD-dependent oxidoreductase [Sphingobium sp.]